MSNLYIGTSGFEYNWNNFYKTINNKKERLKYYSQIFNTVEINYSFYKLPSIKTYKKWINETPFNFCFALKLSRYITHVKRLRDANNAFDDFLKRAKVLEHKLGPILIQLPSNFKLDFKVMKDFLIHIKNSKKRFAFEFRNNIFNSKDLINLFKKHNIAIVFSHASTFPYFKKEEITSDFIYLRLHGPSMLYASSYSDDELNVWANKIKKWKRNKDVYVYFNNDANEYALHNAKKLLSLI